MARIVLRAGKVAVKVTLPIMILAVILCSAKLITPAKANEPPPSVKEIDRLFEQADIQIRKAYELVALNYPDCPGAKIADKWLDRNN
jgi:hypothetical protein